VDFDYNNFCKNFDDFYLHYWPWRRLNIIFLRKYWYCHSLCVFWARWYLNLLWNRKYSFVSLLDYFRSWKWKNTKVVSIRRIIGKKSFSLSPKHVDFWIDGTNKTKTKRSVIWCFNDLKAKNRTVNNLIFTKWILIMFTETRAFNNFPKIIKTDKVNFKKSAKDKK
jgi:hypothetical protein